MKLPKEPNPQTERPSRTAAQEIAAALEGGSFWGGLRWWRRLGVVLLWLGFGALLLAMAAVAGNRWAVVSMALLCIFLGIALLLIGSKWSTTEPWPPHGP